MKVIRRASTGRHARPPGEEKPVALAAAPEPPPVRLLVTIGADDRAPDEVAQDVWKALLPGEVVEFVEALPPGAEVRFPAEWKAGGGGK